MKALKICSEKGVACQSVETVGRYVPAANTIAFSCGPFACVEGGTEGRLPASVRKLIPSVPRMFDYHPTPHCMAGADRSDCSNRHVKGMNNRTI